MHFRKKPVISKKYIFIFIYFALNIPLARYEWWASSAYEVTSLRMTINLMGSIWAEQCCDQRRTGSLVTERNSDENNTIHFRVAIQNVSIEPMRTHTIASASNVGDSYRVIKYSETDLDSCGSSRQHFRNTATSACCLVRSSVGIQHPAFPTTSRHSKLQQLKKKEITS